MSATQISVKVEKQFTYRGVDKIFSNRYYLNATAEPADDAAWDALFDAITTAEKAIYQSGVEIVEAIGYGPGSDLPVTSKTYSLAGTGDFTGAQPAPGDCAALIRYATDQRTSKNHPLYLFNWYHGVCSDYGDPGDTVHSEQLTAYQDYADAWLAGFSDGTNTYIKAGPRGAVAIAREVATVIRHRDFRD